MNTKVSVCFAACCVVWASSLIGVAAESVVLEVQEHGRVDRSGWPVTGGVPFARGKVTDPARLELLDPEGAPVRLQRETLARWEDGSVKWLLVDFFANVAARQTARYTLRSHASDQFAEGPDGARLLWEKTDDGIRIDTGPLRAVVGRRFLHSVSVLDGAGKWVDLIDEPGEMWVTVNGQRQGRYRASRESGAEILLEQDGPNRLCVRISGWHYSDSAERYAPFILRVHAYADKPYLRVFHTFVVSDLPERGLITGIGLRTALQLSGPDSLPQHVNYGGKLCGIGPKTSGSLAQTGFREQKTVHQNEALTTDDSSMGYLAVETPGGTVGCIVRHFAQLYPKTLEFDGRGLTCWFWPESAGPFDLRREEYKQSPEWIAFREQYPKAYAEWIDPGTAKSAGISARRYRTAVRKKQMNVVAGSSALGLARTHEMLWVFLPEGARSDPFDQLAKAAAEPLLPFVDPHYLDETEVLGRLGWEDRESFPRVENYVDRKLGWIIRHQNKWARWWGIVDYGGVRSIYETLRDVTIPGEWLKFMGRHGWHNGEVDIPNHVMYHYLRRGDRRIFRFYESLIRHQMDVDTIHANLPEFEQPGHDWVSGQWTRGGQHRHSYNHYSGAPNIGHTWNEGLVNYYFLTGDRRARDVALEVGEYSLDAPVGKVKSTFERYAKHSNPVHHFSRSPANAYRIALKCYELTGEEMWKREALRWRSHFLDNSPDYLQKQPATFHVTNYVVRTLAADYHILGDPRVGEELVRIARWHCDHIRSGYDQRGLHYPYLACGLAWWIARDNELLTVPWGRYLGECQSSVSRAEGPGDFKQSHFFELGQLPYFLRACDETGLAETPEGRVRRLHQAEETR